MFSRPKSEGAKSEGPVAQFIYDSLAPYTRDDTFLLDLISKVKGEGISSKDDVIHHVTRNTLKDLDLPVSVKTVLFEYYTSQVLNTPIYGECRGELKRAPKIWNYWRRMLADLFFFFEYLYEEGSGESTYWPAAKRNTVLYRHTVNPRLRQEDKDNYHGRIAVKDSKGVVRVELLATRPFGLIDVKDEIKKRLRADSLTVSQAAYVKRNIILEEMKTLQQSKHSVVNSKDKVQEEEEEEEEEDEEDEEFPAMMTSSDALAVNKTVLQQISTFNKNALRKSQPGTAGLLVPRERATVPSVSDPVVVQKGEEETKTCHKSADSTSATWLCPRCTLENESTSKCCEICMCVRPSGLWEAWHCPRCTYINEGQATRCAMCEGARPAIFRDVPVFVEPSNNAEKVLVPPKEMKKGASAPLVSLTPAAPLAKEEETAGRLSPYAEQGPMDEGELVVRFFGMKDGDKSIISINLKRARISQHPFRLGKTGENVRKVKQDENGFRVHSGFWQMLKSINAGCLRQHGKDLVEHIAERAGRDPSKRIVFTVGASRYFVDYSVTHPTPDTGTLDGRLVGRYPALKERLFLVIMGSPKFARHLFSKWVETELADRVMHILLDGDQTPKLPPNPPFFGWYCPGTKVVVSPEKVHKQWGSKTNEEELDVHFQYWQILRTVLATG